MKPRRYNIIKTINYINKEGIDSWDKEISKTDTQEILDYFSKEGYSTINLKKESYIPSEIYEIFFDSRISRWRSNYLRQKEEHRKKIEEEIEWDEKEEEMSHKLSQIDFLSWAIARNYN